MRVFEWRDSLTWQDVVANLMADIITPRTIDLLFRNPPKYFIRALPAVHQFVAGRGIAEAQAKILEASPFGYVACHGWLRELRFAFCTT